ncbi:hypothetical protein GDO86_017724 [Hymenochirus boettgeri]|uniref:G-protein coupled receptors family 1 profile domain-containing protein n=1 Tax=Hymenochirus boettgeri TaxID=247094 RepID=A0A8T2IKQ9_9PIPI|nr:hypothetical protein GDO86_017724 [Hymenochirus boettgeri]
MIVQNYQKSSQNQTILSEILLLGFQSVSSYKFVLLSTFTIVYIFIFSGNLLVILVIVSNGLLHSPMYFFLCNLSLLEILSTNIIIPKMLQVVLGGVTISLYGCLTQLSLFGIIFATENLLFVVMSYDRYLAICRPLHYSSIMHFWNCCCLSANCWTTSFLLLVIPFVFLSKQDFCGRVDAIDHFFCDFGPVLSLSCSDTSNLKIVVYFVSPLSVLCPFLFIIMTYVSIIRSVLKVPSVTGKKKAFSTCSSHLSVVSTYYVTLCMVYLVPSIGRSSQVNKVLSLLYTIVTPLLNPFIYSLNNRDIKAAIVLTIKRNVRGIKVKQ